jgi:hypothetical protein
MKKYLDTYLEKYNTPYSEGAIGWSRFVICAFLIYKLLSRDFSTFAFMPEHMMTNYPALQYSFAFLCHILGVKPVVDLATFHWIHWFIPMPSQMGFTIIQWAAIGFSALVLFFGRGPKRIFVIGMTVLTFYLWGYIYRSGQDVDAVFLPFSCLLLYAISRHKEGITIFHELKRMNIKTRDAGCVYSGFLMCFVYYYFLSGVNKLIDINLLEWFQYDLVGEIALQRDNLMAGHYRYVPPIFELLRGHSWLNYIGVPMVYLSHLLIPVMFFKRQNIASFTVFYWIFHYMAAGVGIWFFGNLLMWFLFLPVHYLFTPIKVTSDTPLINKFKAMDVFGLIEIDNSAEAHKGIFGTRRAAWRVPFMWPFIPVFYLPVISHYLIYKYNPREKAKASS